MTETPIGAYSKITDPTEPSATTAGDAEPAAFEVHEPCQVEMARRILSAPFDHYWSGGEKVEFEVSDLLNALGLTCDQLLALAPYLPGGEHQPTDAP